MLLNNQQSERRGRTQARKRAPSPARAEIKEIDKEKVSWEERAGVRACVRTRKHGTIESKEEKGQTGREKNESAQRRQEEDRLTIFQSKKAKE